jgi:hypothetical protein
MVAQTPQTSKPFVAPSLEAFVRPKYFKLYSARYKYDLKKKRDFQRFQRPTPVARAKSDILNLPHLPCPARSMRLFSYSHGVPCGLLGCLAVLCGLLEFHDLELGYRDKGPCCMSIVLGRKAGISERVGNRVGPLIKSLL